MTFKTIYFSNLVPSTMPIDPFQALPPSTCTFFIRALASKFSFQPCFWSRMRKMERIAQLDQEVAELKSQNTMLGQVSWLPNSTVLYLDNNLYKYTHLRNTATRCWVRWVPARSISFPNSSLCLANLMFYSLHLVNTFLSISRTSSIFSASHKRSSISIWTPPMSSFSFWITLLK